MVLCFDASQQAKQALDMLMKSGDFSNISEAISVALVSYEAIHKGFSHGHERLESRIERSSPEFQKPDAQPKREGMELFEKVSREVDGLTLGEIKPATFTFVKLPNWLFGQYNKELPLKAALRGVVNLMLLNRHGIPIQEAAARVSGAASFLGDFLSSLDDEAKRPREQALCSAFPTNKENSSGSKIRFANQFIGDLRQARSKSSHERFPKLIGFPAEMRFVVSVESRNPVLLLTKPGLMFALMENPILDGDPKTGQKFYKAEVDFLLHHIRNYVPEEASAFISIIDAIEEGSNTPAAMDDYLVSRFGLAIVDKIHNNDGEITQTFLTTQRTGAISRMADLGLVGRIKNGQQVVYTLTESALMFRTAVRESQIFS